MTQGPNVDIVKSVDKTTFNPGDTLNYTITVTNNGAAPANVNFTDNLSAILDDATYNGDAAAAGGGNTSYTAPTLTYQNPSLGAGQTATVTFSVTTTNPGTGNKSLPNRVVSNIGNCVPGSTDPDCITNTEGPNVVTTKTVDKTTFNPGDTLNYTITVENTGAAPANVNITDDLSQILDDATYNNDAAVTGGGAVGYSAPTLTYQNATLGAGQTATITFSVTTANPGTGDKSMPNRVVSNLGNCIQDSTDPDCITNTEGPDVEVVKSVDKTTFNPGDTVTYTIVVSNNGAGPANVNIADDLTPLLDDASYNNNATITSGGGNVSYTAPTITYTNPNLGPAQSATFTFSVTTHNPGTGDKNLRNRVISNTGNCQTGSTDPKCIKETQGPNVTFTKTVDKGIASPGDTLSYTITAANTGNAPANNISYVDNLTPLLDDATYNGDAVASNGGNVSYSAPSLTYSIPTLGAGQTSTVTFTVTTHKPANGDKNLPNAITSNTGNCQAGNTDPNCRATTFLSDVHIKKEVDKTTFNPGDTVNYTLTIENKGTGAATNVSISDDLSAVLDDATYNSNAAVTSGTGSVSYTAPTLTYTNPSLGAGQTAIVTYSVTTANPGTGDKELRNKVVSNYGNCQPGSTDPECIKTSHGPNVVFNKTVDKTVANPGDTVTYTIVGTNNGKASATNVSWVDDLTQLLDDATYNGDAAVVNGTGAVAYSSPNLTYQVPTLNVGDTVTVTFTIKLKKPATGDKVLSNRLVANQGNCQLNSPDPRCNPITNETNVVTRKASDKTTILLDDTVQYTWIVENNGTAAASNVNVSDDLTKVLDDAVYNNDAAITSGPGVLSYTEPEITYQSATLAAGQMATITFTVKVTNPQNGDLVLDNRLKGYDCVPPAICGETKDVTPPTNLGVNKTTAQPSAYEDKNLEYTVTYSNLPTTKNPEPSDAKNVIVTERVPDHTTFIPSESDPIWVCNTATPVICKASVGTVEGGTSGTLKFTVKVDKDFTNNSFYVHNEVTIEDDCASSCPPGGYPKVTVDTPIGKVDMEKTTTTGPITPGMKLTYTITAKNIGTGPVTSHTITDTLSEVLDDATFNNDATVNVGNTHYAEPILTWTGDIQAGQTMTLTYSVTIKKAGSGNGKLVNGVVDPRGISNCTTNSTDQKCTKTTTVSLAKTGEAVLWVAPVSIGLIAAGVVTWFTRRRLIRS